MMIEKEIYGEESMELFGESLAPIIKQVGVVYLNGNLGMGKTTLVRGLLKGLGYIGPVKSPTYTLVEPYELEFMSVYHFDLYRLTDPEELEYMGVRDYFQSGTLCLIEWPELGQGVLPAADIEIKLDILRYGRTVSLQGISDVGIAALSFLGHKQAC